MEEKALFTWIRERNFIPHDKAGYTHTDMSRSASVIRVPYESMDDFYRLYCDDVLHGLRHYLSENADDTFRLFFDLDILLPLDKTMDDSFLRPMLRIMHSVVKDFFSYLDGPKMMTMFVMTRCSLKKDSGMSYGYHVYYPYINVTQDTVAAIRSVRIFPCCMQMDLYIVVFCVILIILMVYRGNQYFPQFFNLIPPATTGIQRKVGQHWQSCMRNDTSIKKCCQPGGIQYEYMRNREWSKLGKHNRTKDCLHTLCNTAKSMNVTRPSLCQFLSW